MLLINKVALLFPVFALAAGSECYRCLWGDAELPTVPPGQPQPPIGEFCKHGDTLSDAENDNVITDGCSSCIKVETRHKGDLIGVLRMCNAGVPVPPEIDDQCVHESYDDFEDTVCTCYGNLCNGSPGTPRGLPAIITILSLLVAYLAAKF